MNLSWLSRCLALVLSSSAVLVSAQDAAILYGGGGGYGGGRSAGRRSTGGTTNSMLSISNPWGAGVAGGALGCLIGYMWANKAAKSRAERDFLKLTSLQDSSYLKKELQWQKEYMKLFDAYSELERELLERDYEEFKAPDMNNDDKISRAEFNDYVRKYLSTFPELNARDFPTFEEFEFEPDGTISFSEWQRFLLKQRTLEQGKANAGALGGASIDNTAPMNVLPGTDGMYTIGGGSAQQQQPIAAGNSNSRRVNVR